MRIQISLPVALVYLAGISLTTMTPVALTVPIIHPKSKLRTHVMPLHPRCCPVGSSERWGRAAIEAGVGALAGLLGGMIASNQMDNQDGYEAQVALQQIRCKTVD